MNGDEDGDERAAAHTPSTAMSVTNPRRRHSKQEDAKPVNTVTVNVSVAATADVDAAINEEAASIHSSSLPPHHPDRHLTHSHSQTSSHSQSQPRSVHVAVANTSRSMPDTNGDHDHDHGNNSSRIQLRDSSNSSRSSSSVKTNNSSLSLSSPSMTPSESQKQIQDVDLDTIECSPHPSRAFAYCSYWFRRAMSYTRDRLSPSRIRRDWRPKHSYRAKLVACVTFGFLLFFLLYYFDSFAASVSGYGRPMAITCFATAWDFSGCGLNGADCQPFESEQWTALRCPHRCKFDVTEESVIGGGGGIYRADSRICAAALHAGVIDDDEKGGCFLYRPAGQQAFFEGGTTSNGISSLSFRSWFPGSLTFSRVDSRYCSQFSVAILFLGVGWLFLLVLLRPPPMLTWMALLVWGFWYVLFSMHDRDTAEELVWVGLMRLPLLLGVGYMLFLAGPRFTLFVTEDEARATSEKQPWRWCSVMRCLRRRQVRSSSESRRDHAPHPSRELQHHTRHGNPTTNHVLVQQQSASESAAHVAPRPMLDEEEERYNIQSPTGNPLEVSAPEACFSPSMMAPHDRVATRAMAPSADIHSPPLSPGIHLDRRSSERRHDKPLLDKRTGLELSAPLISPHGIGSFASPSSSPSPSRSPDARGDYLPPHADLRRRQSTQLPHAETRLAVSSAKDGPGQGHSIASSSTSTAGKRKLVPRLWYDVYFLYVLPFLLFLHFTLIIHIPGISDIDLDANFFNHGAGGILLIVFVCLALLVLVVYHMKMAFSINILFRYLLYYFYVAAFIIFVSILFYSSARFHLHHVMAGVLLVPISRFPSRVSLVFQACSAAIFVNGLALWGWEGGWDVLPTPVPAVWNPANRAPKLYVFNQTDESVMLAWRFYPPSSDAIGTQLELNDVEILHSTDFESSYGGGNATGAPIDPEEAVQNSKLLRVRVESKNGAKTLSTLSDSASASSSTSAYEQLQFHLQWPDHVPTVSMPYVAEQLASTPSPSPSSSAGVARRPSRYYAAHAHIVEPHSRRRGMQKWTKKITGEDQLAGPNDGDDDEMDLLALLVGDSSTSAENERHPSHASQSFLLASSRSSFASSPSPSFSTESHPPGTSSSNPFLPLHIGNVTLPYYLYKLDNLLPDTPYLIRAAYIMQGGWLYAGSTVQFRTATHTNADG